jgi:hypothetical protein
MAFPNVTTRDVLAVMTVGAALVFNGISLTQGLDPDVATMTFAGVVVGYYFRDPKGAVAPAEAVEPPFTGEPE